MHCILSLLSSSDLHLQAWRGSFQACTTRINVAAGVTEGEPVPLSGGVKLPLVHTLSQACHADP